MEGEDEIMSIFLIDGWYDLHRTKGYEKKHENDKIFGSKITEYEAKKFCIDLDTKCFGYVFASSFRKMFMPSENVIEGIANGNIYNVIISDKITKTIDGQRKKSEYVCYFGDDKWFNMEGEVTRREFYQNNVKFDFRIPALVEIIQKEFFKNEMLLEIEKYVTKIRADRNKETFVIVRDRLLALLQGVSGYDEYSRKLMIKFLGLLKSSDSDEKWIQAVYYYIYFAFTMQIHPDVGFKSYERYYEDREEYIKEVIDANNGLGMLTNTINLTIRTVPNVYALYVLSEEYEKEGAYKTIYELLSEALKINPDHPQINYKMAKLVYEYPLRIRCKVTIERMEKKYDFSEDKYCMQQCLDIISCLERSCRMQYAPAYELLGDILELSDEYFPYKGENEMRSPILLYQASIECGNSSSYAKKARSLLKLCYESSFTDLKTFDEALSVLNEGAKNNDYFCLKYLGYIYYCGISDYIEREPIVGVRYWAKAAFIVPQTTQVLDEFEVLITLLSTKERNEILIPNYLIEEYYLEAPVILFEAMSENNLLQGKALNLCKEMITILESFRTEKCDLLLSRVLELLKVNERR